MRLIKKTISVFLILLLFCHCNARPWLTNQTAVHSYTGTFVPYLVQELDTWAASILSQSQVPMIGAGAALVYLGYAGTMLLTSDNKPPTITPRFDNTSSNLLTGMATHLITNAIERSESAAAFRRTGARALQHGAAVLRRWLNAFTRAVGFLFSALSTSHRALHSDCIAKHLCRVGQMTGMTWPILGALLRSLDSADLDEYSQALIDGTTVGDCGAIYHNCQE